jgi:hypothetical protein
MLLMMMGDDDKVKNCDTTITIDSNTDAKENSPNASSMTFIVSSKCLSLPDIDSRYAHV